MARLEGTGLRTVPVLHRGQAGGEQLRALIGPSAFASSFENPVTGKTDNLMEGLYCRTEAGGVVSGRAKVVRAEFVEKVKQSEHWQHQAMTPNELAEGGHMDLTNPSPRWSELTAATNAEIAGWAERQPWARAMAACGQDAEWHGEGDVWTHTRMVCAALESLEEWSSFDRATRLKLFFTALLHDAGKPATSAVDPETGRTRSPKHALAGAAIARRVLRELECGLETREEIVSLVRHHSRPAHLLEKEKPEDEVISLSWLTDNRLLYWFALADTRGRRAGETRRPEENLHLWRMVAEERGCFGAPFAFANNQARFLFYRGQLGGFHYVPYEDYRCTATIMSGLPGAGKDTWLARRRPDLPVVALDAVRDALDSRRHRQPG